MKSWWKSTGHEGLKSLDPHMHKLKTNEITQALKALNGWTVEPDEIYIFKELQFQTFKSAIGFIVRMADIADRLDHHPELLSIYTKIRIRLSTHDASGLTYKDFELAAEIDTLYKSQFQ